MALSLHIGLRAMLPLLAAQVALPTYAQPADLGVVATSTGRTVTQTLTQTVTFVVSNAGPGVAAEVTAMNFSSSTQLWPAALVNVGFDGCVMQVVPGTDRQYRWQVGALGVGESRRCSVTFRAAPTAVGRLLLVGLFVSGNGQPDPNAFNDADAEELAISPIDIYTDMLVTARVIPPGLITPGRRATLRLSIRNAGPDAASRAGAGTSSYPFGPRSEARFELLGAGDPDCDLFYTDVGGVGGNGRRSLRVILVRPLQPGETIDCDVSVVALPGAEGADDLRITAFNGGFGVQDADLENNVTVVRLQFTPPAVPTIDARGLAVLVLALAITGLMAATALARPGLRRASRAPY